MYSADLRRTAAFSFDRRRAIRTRAQMLSLYHSEQGYALTDLTVCSNVAMEKTKIEVFLPG